MPIDDDNGAGIPAGPLDTVLENPPCLECDGSGWLGDDETEICCECDGTGIAQD